MTYSRLRNVLLVVGLIIVGALVVNSIRQRAYTASVNIDAAPLSASITIDGHHSHQGISHLKPGNVTVIVSHSGFSTVTQHVRVNAHDTQYVGVVLRSNDPTTNSWYYQHPEDQRMVEKISSKHFDDAAQQLVKQYPVVKVLPYIGAGFEFRIDYATPPGTSTPTIIIQADTQTAKDDALTWLRSHGYDPNTLHIVYTTSDNTNNGD